MLEEGVPPFETGVQGWQSTPQAKEEGRNGGIPWVRAKAKHLVLKFKTVSEQAEACVSKVGIQD